MRSSFRRRAAASTTAVTTFRARATLGVVVGVMVVGGVIGAAPATAIPMPFDTCYRDTLEESGPLGTIKVEYSHTEGRVNYYRVYFDGKQRRPDQPNHPDNWTSCAE